MALQKQRDIGLDVIRCVALLCVNCVHFFMYSGFYNEVVTGKFMFVLVLMRNAFMICVPLFLLLTGYLVSNAVPSKRYYIKLIRIIGIYFLAAVCCGIYKVFILKNGLTITDAIIGIFTFTTAQYVWYVEMYIGLFLLIPFLNMLYNSLVTKQNKQYLLIVMLILTALPSVCNIYQLDSLLWWLEPSSSHTYLKIAPQFWVSLYPITYFYIGRYLHEYPIKINTFVHLLLIIGIFFVGGVFNYYRSYNSAMVRGLWQEYGSLLITVQAVLVFTFLESLDYTWLPKFAAKIIAKLSDWSFGAYLLSWIFDYAVYTSLYDTVIGMHDRFKCFVFVPVIFIASSLLSGVITKIYNLTFGRIVAGVQRKC